LFTTESAHVYNKMNSLSETLSYLTPVSTRRTRSVGCGARLQVKWRFLSSIRTIFLRLRGRYIFFILGRCEWWLTNASYFFGDTSFFCQDIFQVFVHS